MDTRRRFVISLLTTLVALDVFTAELGWAQNRRFTGAPAFTVAPSVPNGAGNVTTIDRGTGKQLVTLPGGFKHSNRNIAYTVAQNDLNKNLTLVWTIRRPFTRPRPELGLMADKFDGYVQIPPGGQVVSLSMISREVGVPASTLSLPVAVAGWAPGDNIFQETGSTPAYAVGAGAGLLEQTVRLEFRAAQIGTFEIGLPDSAETELLGVDTEPCDQCADVPAQVLVQLGRCSGDQDFDPAADVDASGCVDQADFDQALVPAGLAPVLTSEPEGMAPLTIEDDGTGRVRARGAWHNRRLARQGGEEGGGVGVVAEGLAQMGEAVDVARAEDEAAPELERVVPGPVLPIAGGSGARPGGGVAETEQVQDRRAVEPGGPVGLALRVEQEREADPGLVAEGPGVLPVPQPDGGEVDAGLLELLLVRAQLRHVLAAEDSAVVTEEDQDRHVLGPQEAEPDRSPLGVRQRDPGQALGEGQGHAATSTRVSL
jgi:hypothetical protein